VLLGQLVDTATRGPLSIYVRRAWAEENLPERARRWEKAEEPGLRRAYQLRRDRLAAWRRERVKEPGGEDRISTWLDLELDRPKLPGEPPKRPLQIVMLNRAEVKDVVRRPKPSAMMLRQGWLSGFRDVESMKLDDLKSALEDRGFAVGGEEPVSIA